MRRKSEKVYSGQSPVITVKDVSKKFRVYYDKSHSIKEKFLFSNRNHYEDRWVLNQICLNVYRGQTVGLLGENGCGKSTLLKMLTRIMHPDKGEITINGRVSSLLELGAGFHPDLSGRENIYINASIFGLTRKQIDKKLQDIIDFSELEMFLDNPVRTYSSGMYMRLAFSVAINVNADILLIDEILAVGDANFQSKCFQKLRELKASGATIVLVSHDLSTIESFCDYVVWIKDGFVEMEGKSKNVVEDYRQYMNEKMCASIDRQNKTAEIQVQQHEEDILEERSMDNQKDTVQDEQITDAVDCKSNRFGLRYIEITGVKFVNQHQEMMSTLIEGERVVIIIDYKVNKPLAAYNFGMGFFTMDDVCIYGTNTTLDGLEVKLDKKEGSVCFTVKELQLLTGRYYLQVAVVDVNAVPMDYYRKYMEFDVISFKKSIGLTDVKHCWEID